MLRIRASRIGAELLMMSLVIGSLAGAVGLIVWGYHASRARPKPAAAVIVATPAAPEPPPPATVPVPAPPPMPAEDLTPARLAEIAAREAEVLASARDLDARASALEATIRDTTSKAKRFRVREKLVREGAAKVDREAQRAEDLADALARERDVLAERLKEEQADLSLAQFHAKDGVAVVPYKGPNGTWRRPIAIDCRGGTAQLQPGGPSYTFEEMSGVMNRRTHPLVIGVARAMVRWRDVATPDGAPSVPYIMFLVRPDGIRPFYAARGLLEPLGIAFGYELVDANADIDFPEPNDPAAWADAPLARGNSAWPPPIDDPGAGGNGAGELGSVQPPRSAGYGSGRGRVIPPATGSFGSGGRGIARAEGSSDESWPRSRGTGDGPSFGNRMDGEEIEALARLGGSNGSIVEPPASYDPRKPGSLANATAEAGARSGRQPASRPSPDALGGDLDFPTTSESGAIGSRSLRDAIARNEGLTAPSLAPPSRSTPDSRSTTQPTASLPGSPPSGTASGTENGLPGTNSPQPARTPPSNRATSPGTASQGSQPPQSARVTPSGSSTASGGTPQGSQTQPSTSASPSGTSANPGGMPQGSPSQPSPPSPGSEGGQAGQGSTGASWSSSRGLASKSFDLSVACGPDGVTIHPGGLTIDAATMAADDSRLPATLARIVNEASRKDPEVGLRPQIRLISKAGGETTFLKARYQVSRLGAGWPVAIQLADRSAPRMARDGGKR